MAYARHQGLVPKRAIGRAHCRNARWECVKRWRDTLRRAARKLFYSFRHLPREHAPTWSNGLAKEAPSATRSGFSRMMLDRDEPAHRGGKKRERQHAPKGEVKRAREDILHKRIAGGAQQA